MSIKLLTKKEIADRLRLSERTIDRYRSLGLLRAVKARTGGKVLFREEDLDAFLKKHLEACAA